MKPVSYYEIGSGKWRTARTWLPKSVRAKTFQLDGAATPGTPGSLVLGAVTTNQTDDVYPVPVAGLCNRSASQWTAGPLSGTPCDGDNRINDASGTSYETAPLAKLLHLMGPINAKLFVSTTVKGLFIPEVGVTDSRG